MAESLTFIHDRNFSISESNIQSIGAENFIQPMGKKQEHTVPNFSPMNKRFAYSII
jgi:hypothetical protein